MYKIVKNSGKSEMVHRYWPVSEIYRIAGQTGTVSSTVLTSLPKAIGGQIYKGRHKSMRRSVTNAKDLHPTFINWEEFLTRKSIPYWRLYRFGQRYDIFRIPVNTGVPFRIYHYFLLFYTIYKVIFLITQYITLATFYIDRKSVV